MSTEEQENDAALMMFQGFEASHRERQAQLAADIEHTEAVRRAVLKTHPETMSAELQRTVRNMLTTYLDAYRLQIEETMRIAESRYSEMRYWYEFAGILPQANSQPADQSPHGAGPDDQHSTEV